MDSCEVLGRAPEQYGPSGNDLKVPDEGGHQEASPHICVSLGRPPGALGKGITERL